MADETKFTMGDNIAAQPGKVVRRGELYELIQFDTVTEMVDEVPVFLISSPVNKYYLVDLRPRGLGHRGRPRPRPAGFRRVFS